MAASCVLTRHSELERAAGAYVPHRLLAVGALKHNAILRNPINIGADGVWFIVAIEIRAKIIYGELKPQGKWPLRLIGIDETVADDDERDHSIAGHFSAR